MMQKSSGSGNNIGDDVVKRIVPLLKTLPPYFYLGAISDCEVLNLLMKTKHLRLCPLCNSPVRFLCINFTEKVLLCENILCDYPFNEDLQFVPLDCKVNIDKGASSLARHNKSKSSSVTSYSAWSDITKFNKVHRSEVSQQLNLNVEPKKSKRKTKSNTYDINNKELKKNVQDLTHASMELNKVDQYTDESDYIKNKKWLQNLMKLQGLSGVKLVKKEEMKLLKQKTPAFGGGELKIDIGTNSNNISTINVQIMNKHGD